MKKLLLTLLVFTFSTACKAEDSKQIAELKKRCEELSKETEEEYIFAEKQKEVCVHGGQQSMNICMANEYKKVDAKLSYLYSRLVDKLERPQGIKKSQRAWLKYRDAECSDDVMQIGTDNSLYPYARFACLIEFTEERIKYLKWHLEQDCSNCPQ